MGKDQIYAADMQIKGLAEILHRHRRTLDVPTGPATSNWRLPTGFVHFRRFPQREVARIFLFVLVGIDAVAAARDVAGEVDLRKLSVLRKGSDAIVNRAVRAI